MTYYKKALQLNPTLADVYNYIGAILSKQGQLDEAMTYCQKALQLNPTLADAYNNIGAIFYKQEQLDEAMTYYQKALDLKPELSNAYNNIGILLQEKGEPDKAIEYFRNALLYSPDFADAYSNMGITLLEKGETDKAIEFLSKAIKLDPDHAMAHWNLSLTLLLTGEFRKGWKEYEWRWKLKDSIRYSFSQSLWDGSDITGRTVLLHDEQGFGDTIQFIRYASLVAQRGARVIIWCKKELKTLIQNIEGVDRVVARGEQLPHFDIHCPLLSMPLVFNTTLESIPAKIPYITADLTLVQKWRDKVQYDNSKLKVGLVWGTGEGALKKIKSFPLDVFSHLATFNDVTFYSLQKGGTAEQIKNPPKGMKIIDYMGEINDFADTAAIIENLDLVISADTAVAHLAGALGKPVWTLISFVPIWRWMLNREDSPWYPTMRLFRQPSLGDWESVIAIITDRLRNKIREINT